MKKENPKHLMHSYLSDRLLLNEAGSNWCNNNMIYTFSGSAAKDLKLNEIFFSIIRGRRNLKSN